MVFIQSFVELFMLPEFLHSMCNLYVHCLATSYKFRGFFFVRAISYFALFVVHQEAETRQDEFHKIPKNFAIPALNTLAALCF